MRTTIVMALTLLCLSIPASCTRRGTDNACEFALPAQVTALTDDEPAESASASLEDRALLRRITDEGTRLIEAGRVTKGLTLIEQLRQERHPLDLPEPRGLSSGAEALYRQARDAVVILGSLFKCQKCSRWHATAATGFVLTATGAIVTNYHVINDPEKETFVVMTADQRVFPVARVLAASRAHDLAVLQIDANGLTPLTLATARDAAPIGSPVHLISHPAGRFYSYTSGVVSRHMKQHLAGADVEGLSITADYARGSSGAPVLNSQGQVVAIVRSTESVYHGGEGNRGRNLQMVFKDCIPSRSLLPLIAAVPASDTTPSR